MDVGGGWIPLSRRVELPDFTTFDFPAANLADTAAEEIELDQALSLAGRRGRRYFGMKIQGAYEQLLDSLIADTADVHLHDVWSLYTRTGAFNIDDPELIDRWQIGAALNVTEGSSHHYVESLGPFAGGEVYVAPRLFSELENQSDAQINADTLFMRMATISQRLSFQTFIELLERHADVTLL